MLFGAYAKQETSPDNESGNERKDLTFGLAIGGTVVAAGIAATWALAEHASTGIQPGIAMPVDVLHLLAVATWLGGLSALLVALYRAPAIDSAAVRRFSRIAFASVVVLAATGLYQSWRQVGSWSALGGTSYGQLLLVKVGLVGVLVGIAWISRRWTGRLAENTAAATGAGAGAGARDGVDVGRRLDAETGRESEESRSRNESVVAARLAGPAGAKGVGSERVTQLARQKAALATARQKRLRDADPSRSALRRSVLAEAGVAVVLLAVATILSTTEPGRTAEQETGRTDGPTAAAPVGPLNISMPFDTGGRNGKGTVELTLGSGSTGPRDMQFRIEGPDSRPLDVPEVKAAFTLSGPMVMGPLPIAAKRVAPGQWRADNIQIPMPGEWQIKVTVRTSDIDETTVEKNVKIG